MSRDTIGSIARAGLSVRDRWFSAVLAMGAASPGLSVSRRSATGDLQVAGFLHSALNADAARAFRYKEVDIARRLAARAAEIEHTPEARFIFEAVQTAALETSPTLEISPDVHQSLLASGAAYNAEFEAMVHAPSWWARTSTEIGEASLRLEQFAAEARESLIGLDHQRIAGVTFFGVVRSIEPEVAEVEAGGQVTTVAVRDLQERGLDRIGQAVCLLWEATASGPEVIVMPATEVHPTPLPVYPSAFDVVAEDGPTMMLDAESWDWVQRAVDTHPPTLRPPARSRGK